MAQKKAAREKPVRPWRRRKRGSLRSRSGLFEASAVTSRVRLGGQARHSPRLRPRIRHRPQTACGRCRPWEPTALHDSSGIRYHLAANTTATPSLKRGPCQWRISLRPVRRNRILGMKTAKTRSKVSGAGHPAQNLRLISRHPAQAKPRGCARVLPVVQRGIMCHATPGRGELQIGRLRDISGGSLLYRGAGRATAWARRLGHYSVLIAVRR